MVFLCLLMMPLATTELGTDGAITGIMAAPLQAAEWSPLWVLVYTSASMCVLRFFAGPIVQRLTPLGLLAACAGCASLGLFALAHTETVFWIFAAATLYGIGKTFFWPTTLGVVAEQFPTGGALTLNAIAGIGMLTVGIIGGPLIGEMQENAARQSLETNMPGVYEEVSKTDNYFLGEYHAVDMAKVDAMSAEKQGEIKAAVGAAKQGALANMTVFPLIMLACYIGLIFYFRSRGGYKPVEIEGQDSAH